MLDITSVSDADYYLRSCSPKGGPEGAEVSAGPAEYELEAVAAGEPPGVWAHRGRDVLSLSGEIKADGPSGETFRSLVNKLVDPRTGVRLGPPPRRFKSAEERLAEFRRKNPDATPEQRKAAQVRAELPQRHAVHAYDLTFSSSKSWGLLHAALQREGRPEDAEQVWQAFMAGVDAALTQAAEEHGYTREGVGGPKVEGRATTTHRRNENFVMGVFRHHTSRNQDPQLHAHVMLLNRVLCEDGQWRALHAQPLFKSKHQLDATFARVSEAELTRRLGYRFVARPDGTAREIEGVSRDVQDMFSVRSRALSERAQEMVDQYTAVRGQAPPPLVQWQMQQRAARETRRAKPDSPPSRAEELLRWEQSIGAEFRHGFERVVADTDETRAAEGEAITVPPLDADMVIAQALADLEKRDSTWSRSRLYFAISQRMPDVLAIEPARIPEVLTEMTDAALAGREVLSVVAPSPAGAPPRSLRDPRTGRSVFDAPAVERFTTKRHLEREDSLVARLEQRGTRSLPADSARVLLEPFGLSVEQADVATAILASDRKVELLNAPAGVGKSRVMAALSAASEQAFGHGLVGFAVAQNAAEVLAAEGVERAFNVARFVGFHERLAAGEASAVDEALFAITPGATGVIDEASTLSTPDFTAFVKAWERAGGGKLILAGDTEQVDAVDAAGAFAMLCDQREPHTLVEVRRFASEWERDASVRLRAGDATALTAYEARGRLWGDNDTAKVLERAVTGFVTDHLSGRDSVIVVGSSEQARDVSSHVRERLVRAGAVERDGVPIRGHVTAGIGDVIATRQNDRDLTVVNRETWQVVGTTDAGDLEVRRLLGRDEDGGYRFGETRQLPAAYVAAHVELGYAGTTEAVQGRTTDTGHSVIGRWTGRSRLYPASTRGREANHLYVVLEGEETALGRLAEVVGDDDHAQAARTAIRAEQDRADHLGVLGPEWQTLITEDRAAAHVKTLRLVLSPVDAEAVLADEASDGVFRQLRAAESAGYLPGEVLVNAYRKGGTLAGARSPASALFARLDDELKTTYGPDRRPFTYLDRTPVADGSDERMVYARRVAAAMDARVQALGERVAAEAPEWAVARWGPVPVDALDRAGWAGRAGPVEAYREQFGWHAARNPIGPQPSRAEPERLWVWNRAADVLGMDPRERDLAGLSDGDLANRVQAWERQLAWAPRNVDDDLRGAHEALREARTQEVNTRVQGREDADAVADVWAMTELVEKLEFVAQVRARWHDHTTDAREEAEEARAEQRRRREVEQARGGLHPDDPGVEVEPDWDEEYDDAGYEELLPGDVDGENVFIPRHSGRAVDPREAAHEAVMARVAATWTPDQPAVFGSREWSLLDDEAPEKRAAVVAAAARLFNFGQPLDADRAEVDRRLNVRDVEEPAEWPDVETTARTQFWAEDHGLLVEAPRFGSPEWLELADDDPRREASETYAATVWLNGGDDLDSRRARADKADEDAREAAAAREVAEGPHVEALDQHAAELERDAEPGGFQRPQVEPEPEAEGVEGEVVDRSRYAWVREAAERHEEARRIVVEAEVPAPREPEVVEEPDVAPEPVPDPGAERAAKDAQLRDDLDRATAAADRMERDEAAARERDADEQRQRDDDRAREVERDEQDRERVDY